ncbi:MAG TPA: DEAD/DEAH box helicase [Gemmataceae bacterium]|nr:DEAD/DEAH box helicase [Gemmataceae bacterium]
MMKIRSARLEREKPVRLSLGGEQQDALDAAVEWRSSWADGGKQEFVISGLAGTGKSTMIPSLVEAMPRPMVVCPTGKAAHVLRAKGVEANTIHSKFYWPVRNRREGAKFRPKTYIDADTIIVDEASMVDSEMLQNMLRFGIPILFIGDPGQLGPVQQNPGLMDSPDFLLKQIHRQADGNPILSLAYAFREGREHMVRRAMASGGIWRSPKGECIVATPRQLEDYLHFGAQVIVGFNRTRHELNERIRSRRGIKGPPQVGEQIICLANNPWYGMFNGQQCTVIEVIGHNPRFIELCLRTDDGKIISAPCLLDQFGRDRIDSHRDNKVLQADFGYALTAHKAQGCEFDSVVVLEEIYRSRDASRWRYTAVTRAKKRLVYLW